MKTWVLTGDKEETAVNVGFAAGILNVNTQRLTLNSGNTSKLLTQIGECKEALL